MGDNGLGKKLLVVGALVAVVVFVLRAVRGGDEEPEGIDRIDTGNERNVDPVDTGLDRVDTADDTDADEDDAEADESVGTSGTTGTTDTTGVATPSDGGRFDHLDVFDYVAILGAAFKAAKREYEARS